MSDASQGPGWWMASDERWYPPELHPSATATASPPEPVRTAAAPPQGDPPAATFDPGLSERGEAAPPFYALAVVPPPVDPGPPAVDTGEHYAAMPLPTGLASAEPAAPYTGEHVHFQAPPLLPPGGKIVPETAAGKTVSGRRKRSALIVGLVAVVVLAGVVVFDVLHSGRGAPPAGTAIAVTGERTNILPNPNFLVVCSASVADNSAGCIHATLSAIDNARGREGLPALVLPENWSALTPAQQLFVVTNLERTARGLRPITGMAATFDAVAAAGAAAGTDPPLTAAGSDIVVGGNWIQGYSNPLEADYQWVYDDGLGSTNVECTRKKLTACWAHRANILLSLDCNACGLGAAFVATDKRGEPLSYAELLVESESDLTYVFTWSQEVPHLG